VTPIKPTFSGRFMALVIKANRPFFFMIFGIAIVVLFEAAFLRCEKHKRMMQVCRAASDRRYLDKVIYDCVSDV
jgi:hypothetical protein